MNQVRNVSDKSNDITTVYDGDMDIVVLYVMIYCKHDQILIYGKCPVIMYISFDRMSYFLLQLKMVIYEM